MAAETVVEGRPVLNRVFAADPRPLGRHCRRLSRDGKIAHRIALTLTLAVATMWLALTIDRVIQWRRSRADVARVGRWIDELRAGGLPLPSAIICEDGRVRARGPDERTGSEGVGGWCLASQKYLSPEERKAPSPQVILIAHLNGPTWLIKPLLTCRRASSVAFHATCGAVFIATSLLLALTRGQ
jgi:hypothetical protein